MVYYGKTSCKDNFENYIEIIKYVFSSYKREAPLIVNTMGWVAGKAGVGRGGCAHPTGTASGNQPDFQALMISAEAWVLEDSFFFSY